MHRIAPAAPPKRSSGVEIAQPVAIRTPKLLSLLMILEALRQAPCALDAQKV